MFGWFKKKPKPTTPPDSEEFRQYSQAIEQHQDHPTVQRWFHQITPCSIEFPGQGRADFLMIEFRDGRQGAMVWSDGAGNWGTGGWLARTAADVLPIDISYLQNAPAAPSFAGVLDLVAERRGAGAAG